MLLSKAVKVTDNENKALAYYGFVHLVYMATYIACYLALFTTLYFLCKL